MLQRIKTKHLHWVDWPDRGVPPADTAIIQVLDIIKSTQLVCLVLLFKLVPHIRSSCRFYSERPSSSTVPLALEELDRWCWFSTCSSHFPSISQSKKATNCSWNWELKEQTQFKCVKLEEKWRRKARQIHYFQTDQQYLFVHQVLLNYFQENQLLDPRWKPYLDHFTKEYNKFVF